MGLFHKHNTAIEVLDKYTVIYCKDCGKVIHKEKNCRCEWELISKLTREEVEQLTKSVAQEENSFNNTDKREYENILVKNEVGVFKCSLCGDIKEI